MVPGFEERVRAWEAALGLPPRAEATQVQRTAGEAAATLPQRLRTLWRVVRNFVRLEADVRRFKERFHHVQTEFERCGPETQDADGLVDLYEFLVRELLAHWEITTVNDFYAFQLFDLLGTLLARWGSTPTGRSGTTSCAASEEWSRSSRSAPCSGWPPRCAPASG